MSAVYMRCGAIWIGWGTRSWNSGRCDIVCCGAVGTRAGRPPPLPSPAASDRASIASVSVAAEHASTTSAASTASASAAAEHASLGFGFELGFGLVTMPLPPLKRRLQRILKPHSPLDLTRSHSICAVPTQRSWSFSRLILRLKQASTCAKTSHGCQGISG